MSTIRQRADAYDRIYKAFTEYMDSGDHEWFGEIIEAIIEQVDGLPNECPMCNRFSEHSHYID